MRSFIVIATLAMTVGCVPFPHRGFRTPIIYGTSQGENQPVLSRFRAIAEPEGDSCDGAHTIEASTDSSGFFLICPDPDFQLFSAIVLAHREFTWNVCVFHDDRWQLVHSGRQYTLVDVGPRGFIELTCSIDGDGPACRETEHPSYLVSPLPQATIERYQCKGVRPAA